MNKKLTITIVTIALLLVGVVYVSSKNHVTPSLTPALTSNTPSSKETALHLKSSFLNDITSKTLIAFSIYPQKLTPISDHFTQLKTKLSQTKLWKLSNTDSLIENTENQIKNTNASNSLLTLIADQWKDISEISLAVLEDTKNPLDTFKTIIALKSSTSELVPQIKSALQKEIPLTYDKNSLSLKITPGSSADEFLLSITASMEKETIQGKIIFENNSAYILINASSQSEFKPGDGETSVLNDSSVLSSTNNETFMVYSIDHENTARMMQAITQKLTPTTEKATTHTPLKGLNKSHGILSFNDGLHMNQCLTYQPSLPLGEKYKALAHTPPTKGLFSKLLSGNTVIGISSSSAYINLFTFLLQNTYSDEVINEASQEPEVKKIIDAFTKHQGLFSNFLFDEVHFILNTPRGGGFTPDAFLLLSGSQKGSEMFLQGVKNFIGDIAGDSLSLSFSKDASGNDSLSIAFDPKFSLFFQYLKDGSLVISPQESTPEEIEKDLSKQRTFSDIATIKGKPLSEIYKGSNFSYFIANEPIFEFGKPFLGLLSLGSQQSKVTTTDIDQALSLLKFIVASTSQIQEKSDHEICFDSLSNFADLQIHEER